MFDFSFNSFLFFFSFAARCVANKKRLCMLSVSKLYTVMVSFCVCFLYLRHQSSLVFNRLSVKNRFLDVE